MRAAEAFRVALEALRANGLRSALTMLGVIIGVAAVVILVAIGSGAKQEVEQQVEGLGSNIIIVVPGRFQRVAWWLLALVPVAAIAGLFGDGLFSEVTAGSERAGGTVSHERFGRLTADTELELEFARPSRTTDIAISRAFLDRYDTAEVRPEPLRVRTLADAVVFTFAAAPAGRATFSLRPKSVGSSSGTVTVVGGTPVHVEQLVYP